jgi:hypothetical protein
MTFRQPHNEFFLAVTPERIAVFATSLFLLITIFYLAIRVTPFFFTPEILIENPPAVSKDATIAIKGRVISASRLTVNGVVVYIEENGFFRADVELRTGVNQIVLEAKNRFGRGVQVVRRVVKI